MASDISSRSDATEAQDGASKADEVSRLQSDTSRDKELVFTPEALTASERADRALAQQERKYKLMVEEAFRDAPPEPRNEPSAGTAETKDNASHTAQESRPFSDTGRSAMQGNPVADDRL
ncbi:MAG TPA: hypothetical protein VF707_07105 [Ardenticatenaceae bacterium]|jgi:hypothetical protein